MYVSMKIAVFQQDIVWNNPAENRRRAAEAIRKAPGSELYVLPEMFSTGFVTEPEGNVENHCGETLGWMRQISSETGAALAGSVAVADGTRHYNRLYFVCPDGNMVWYDKRHLFTYAGEDKHYVAGTRRVITEYGGVRFLLQTCYDLRFPVFSRNCGDYDAILYVASWPESRINVWETLLRARAIENQCYVVGVNRTGSDPTCTYGGGSAIISPRGRTLAACKSHTEETVSAEISMESLMAFRKKFPVLDDADIFEVNLKK